MILGIKLIPNKHTTQNNAPIENVKTDPKLSHSNPASRLAISVAIPHMKLKKPKAVPRKSSGAVRATMAAKRPWVAPICRPHRQDPI